MRLDQIKPPHAVKNQEKFRNLIEAYKRGEEINPVVVLQFKKNRPVLDLMTMM